jgi:hypothetical protein
MAGALFTEAIGLLGTGLGIIQFGMDHFAPGQADPKGTIVGIKAGAGKGASNTLVSIHIILSSFLPEFLEANVIN